jgi:hypothetical protein
MYRAARLADSFELQQCRGRAAIRPGLCGRGARAAQLAAPTDSGAAAIPHGIPDNMLILSGGSPWTGSPSFGRNPSAWL